MTLAEVCSTPELQKAVGQDAEIPLDLFDSLNHAVTDAHNAIDFCVRNQSLGNFVGAPVFWKRKLYEEDEDDWSYNRLAAKRRRERSYSPDEFYRDESPPRHRRSSKSYCDESPLSQGIKQILSL